MGTPSVTFQLFVDGGRRMKFEFFTEKDHPIKLRIEEPNYAV
jgi:hypothetical protein